MDRKDHIDSKSMQPGVTPGFPANKLGIRIVLDSQSINLIVWCRMDSEGLQYKIW